MKPMIFKNEQELVGFLDSIGTQNNTKTVKYKGEDLGAEECLQRIKTLVPKTFRFKEILANKSDGLGNLKSVRRLAGAIADNVSLVTIEEYNQSILDLEDELEALSNIMASDELISEMAKAKTKVAGLKLVHDSIKGFEEKLISQMGRILEKREAAIDTVNVDILGAGVKLTTAATYALKDMVLKSEEDVAQIKRLIDDMVEYCSLQVAFNSLMM